LELLKLMPRAVCGVEYIHDPESEDKPEFLHWVSIAGHFDMHTGTPLEVKPRRLKSTSSDREGLVLEMLGGKDPLEPTKGVQQIKQKAIIELLCDRQMSGWEPKPEPSSKLVERDDEAKGDEPEENVGSALNFVSYNEEPVSGENWKVLKLQWKTKYACEDASSLPPTNGGGSHWGFFTWLIIM
jgi:autophagy-related protein 27